MRSPMRKASGPGVSRGGGGRGVELDGEHGPGGFDDKVDLLRAFLGAEVVESAALAAEGDLGAELSRSEKVEESAEEVAVVEDRANGEPGGARRRACIDEISLGIAGEAGESVRCPGRHEVDDEQVGEQAVVAGGRHRAAARGLAQECPAGSLDIQAA